MDRETLANNLEEIGLLLELKGENPFKTRAYENAGRIVRALEVTPEEWVSSGEMPKTKGIGKALSEKIETLVSTGELDYLNELRASVPDGLRDWLDIQGLGPKKARAIHKALEISTLGELEYACKENRLRDLPGFGEKSQEKILKGIERLKSHAGQFLQSVVWDESNRLLGKLRSVKGVEQAEVAGSVRRRKEISKDIDLVVVATDPEPVMDCLVEDSAVQEVTGRGDTKCSVNLKSGPSVDLRVVTEDAFAFTLLYFTGSKEHNVALRSRAQALGYKLNEYGLEPLEDQETPACKTEEEIYQTLKLEWIPPELREDRGEIEKAESGELPELVERKDLKGVLHCHSTWSDGAASIEEMADAARKLGYQYLGLCDHSQAAAYAGGLSPKKVIEQHKQIDELNEKYDGEFVILKGIESDILTDGSLDYDEEILAKFDLIVASVHSQFNLSAEEQTERILKAVQSPWVDILGHPTGRLLLARDGYPLDLRKILEQAIEHQVVVETNANPRRLDLDWRELGWGLPKGLITAVNPDAHSPDGLEDVHYGLGVARKAGTTAEQVMNAWPLDKIQAWLKERKSKAVAETS